MMKFIARNFRPDSVFRNTQTPHQHEIHFANLPVNMEMYSRQMTDNINCFTGTGSFYGSDARKVRAASDLIQESRLKITFEPASD